MLKDNNEMAEVDVIGVPKWQMDDLCRALLGAVRKFYESEENVKKNSRMEASAGTAQKGGK